MVHICCTLTLTQNASNHNRNRTILQLALQSTLICIVSLPTVLPALFNAAYSMPSGDNIGCNVQGFLVQWFNGAVCTYWKLCTPTQLSDPHQPPAKSHYASSNHQPSPHHTPHTRDDTAGHDCQHVSQGSAQHQPGALRTLHNSLHLGLPIPYGMCAIALVGTKLWYAAGMTACASGCNPCSCGAQVLLESGAGCTQTTVPHDSHLATCLYGLASLFSRSLRCSTPIATNLAPPLRARLTTNRQTHLSDANMVLCETSTAHKRQKPARSPHCGLHQTQLVSHALSLPEYAQAQLQQQQHPSATLTTATPTTLPQSSTLECGHPGHWRASSLLWPQRC